jgi:hypothetical protein
MAMVSPPFLFERTVGTAPGANRALDDALAIGHDGNFTFHGTSGGSLSRGDLEWIGRALAIGLGWVWSPCFQSIEHLGYRVAKAGLRAWLSVIQYAKQLGDHYFNIKPWGGRASGMQALARLIGQTIGAALVALALGCFRL